MNRIATAIIGLFWLTTDLYGQVSLSAGHHHRSESHVDLGKHFTAAKGDYRTQDLFGLQFSLQEKNLRYLAAISFLKEAPAKFNVHARYYWGGSGSFDSREVTYSQNVSFSGTNLKIGIERVFDGKSLLFKHAASSLSFGLLVQTDLMYGLQYGPITNRVTDYKSSGQAWLQTSDTTYQSSGELVASTGFLGSFGLNVTRCLTYKSFFLRFSVSFGLMTRHRFKYTSSYNYNNESEDNYDLLDQTGENRGPKYFLDTGIGFGYVFPSRTEKQK